jgi:hypothetical protein
MEGAYILETLETEQTWHNSQSDANEAEMKKNHAQLLNLVLTVHCAEN